MSYAEGQNSPVKISRVGICFRNSVSLVTTVKKFLRKKIYKIIKKMEKREFYKSNKKQKTTNLQKISIPE